MTNIAANLALIHARIAAACERYGREIRSVDLLAVSKTVPSEEVREAHAAGHTAFGENYVQEGVSKIDASADLRSALQWHCIGPLQSNKTRVVAENFDWVHSIDRLKIAERLSEQRPVHLPPLQVCLQVNIDGGANKSGIASQEALALARAVAMLPRLQLRGLMAIPEPVSDFEAQRELFSRAAVLFNQIRAEGIAMDVLSMGMSADLEAAVAAGSTMVRVGTGIFGARG